MIILCETVLLFKNKIPHCKAAQQSPVQNIILCETVLLFRAMVWLFSYRFLVVFIPVFVCCFHTGFCMWSGFWLAIKKRNETVFNLHSIRLDWIRFDSIWLAGISILFPSDQIEFDSIGFDWQKLVFYHRIVILANQIESNRMQIEDCFISFCFWGEHCTAQSICLFSNYIQTHKPTGLLRWAL